MSKPLNDLKDVIKSRVLSLPPNELTVLTDTAQRISGGGAKSDDVLDTAMDTFAKAIVAAVGTEEAMTRFNEMSDVTVADSVESALNKQKIEISVSDKRTVSTRG